MIGATYNNDNSDVSAQRFVYFSCLAILTCHCLYILYTVLYRISYICSVNVSINYSSLSLLLPWSILLKTLNSCTKNDSNFIV